MIADRLAAVRHTIDAAAARAGRRPAEVTLVAVSKGRSLADVRAALEAGQREFGENRVEEAITKIRALGQEAEGQAAHWHMIGHIQSRKARDVIGAGFELLHSVDSVRLAQRLSRAAQDDGIVQPVLLEFNVSGEASKAGFSADRPDQWSALLGTLEPIMQLPGLKVAGCMTMAPLTANAGAARPYFERQRQLRDLLAATFTQADWAILSMGMSGDYEAAIEEGANLVRIGRAIFDQPV